MSNALTRRESAIPALAMPIDELIDTLESSLYPGADRSSIKLVVNWCRAQQKDPMKKPVHIVPMSVKKPKTNQYEWRDVIMPGIGDYRIDAARTGQYAGIGEAKFGPDVQEKLGNVDMTYPDWCEVSVYRMVDGQRCEFSSGKVWWKETYATAGRDNAAPNAMWKKRPRGQLEKCAEAMALRRAFPEVGAAPTSEEMEGRVIDDGMTVDGAVREVNAIDPKPNALPLYSDEAFDRNFPAWSDLIKSGKKTPQELMAMLSTRASFSDLHRARILSIRANVPDESPMRSESDDEFIAQMDAAEEGDK